MSEIRIPRPRLVARHTKRVHSLQLSPSQNVEAMLDELAEKVREARQKILGMLIDPMRVSKISVGKLIALSVAAYIAFPAAAVATNFTSALNTRFRTSRLPFPLLWVAFLEASLIICTIIFFKALLFLVPAAFTGFHLWCCGQLLATRRTKQFIPVCVKTLASMENRVEKSSHLMRITFLNSIEATLKFFEPTDLDLRSIGHARDLSTWHKTPLLVSHVKVTHPVEDQSSFPIHPKHKLTMPEPTPLAHSENPHDFDQDSWLLVPGPQFWV
ncbi:hypothetical protein CPB83DRAFT_862286 [Crepidotus variabilis]|uniref:Uncharacterized protein n=1 Tax=Crepidotus variabilis TaxID=179855 RepID=A0A9P6JK08_9AGAR|nr:hypothetical protein CPB83DRAFT_862286 [Crepidotus variabilis]